jgi:hypothetical protein
MDRFVTLLPSDLFTILKKNNNKYTVIVYPIMINYYIDESAKYEQSKIKSSIERLIKTFTDFLKTLEENVKLPNNLFDYLKTVADSLIEVGIGVKITMLKKGIYYRNYKKNTNE